jgi:restriction endonuclease Mrr
MKLYDEVCDQITVRESKNTIKKILDILSHNTIHNIKDMNKSVISLFKMDEEFKKLITSD